MAAFRIFRRLSELLDVALSSPSDGDVLAYNAGSSSWENSAAAGGGSSTLAGLTDVTGTAGTGKSPVSDGAGAFPLTDIATQAELNTEAASRISGDSSSVSTAEAYTDAAVAALSATYQPLDSDLTAIAALTTTSFGRAVLALADAASLRTAAGLGTAAVAATGDFDAAGAAAAAQAASQPLDSDLTAIAALTTTSFGRAFLALADAAAGRTALGLGTLATQSGTFSGTSSGTNTGDQTLPTRASLGLDTTDSPQFAGLNVGAATDTTITRTGAGDVAVEGNQLYRAGGTDVAVADGGTGASTASDARTNLGLVIATDVEAHDPDLTTIAGLSPTNDDVLQRKAGAWANRSIAQLLADLSAAGTTFQPLDSDLTAWAAITITNSPASGKVLTATDATHASWVTPSASPISVLFDSTLGADAASIDTGANGIAGTASHLLIVYYARTTEAAVLSSANLTINGDTGGNYDRITNRAANATVSSNTSFASSAFTLNAFGANAASGAFLSATILLPGYAKTVGQKQLISLNAEAEASGANSKVETAALRWRSTAAVTRMALAAGSGNLLAGSSLTIYGLV